MLDLVFKVWNMNRRILSIRFCSLMLTFFAVTSLVAQELYVFTEPASTKPARAIGVKHSVQKMGGNSNRTNQNTQIQFGLSKKLSLYVGTNYSGTDAYAQYRFYTKDAMYAHTRLAFYTKAIQTKNTAVHTNAVLLDGEESVLGGGLIVTQLKHKWASSLSLGYVQKQDWSRHYGRNAFQYSFSNGLLVYPKRYSSYGQTNVNLYLELLGQKLLSGKGQYLDAAPSIQLIFNSQAKVNLGYRFALLEKTNRMTNNSLYLSVDYLFFNALPKAKQRKKP
jgi:hypothetical protein